MKSGDGKLTINEVETRKTIKLPVQENLNENRANETQQEARNLASPPETRQLRQKTRLLEYSADSLGRSIFVVSRVFGKQLIDNESRLLGDLRSWRRQLSGALQVTEGIQVSPSFAPLRKYL